MLTLLLAAALISGPAKPTRPQAPTLQQAIDRLHDFDDDGALKVLQQVLATHPPTSVEARCHLYLGLIAINHIDSDQALEEFKTTLRLDFTVEPTIDFSPKGRVLFDRARQLVARESEGLAARPARPAPSTPPPTPVAVAAPLAPAAPSKVPGIVVGATGVVALGAGVVFGVLSNAAVSNAQQTSSGSAATSQLSNAKTDALAADLLMPAGGALAIAGGILLILELTSKGSGEVVADVVPIRGGAAAAFGGRF